VLIFPTVVIEANKEGVKFSCSGDIGSGAVTIRQHTNVDKPDQNVTVNISEPVALTFSLKYLVNFCKASNLSSSVVLHLSQEVPLLVEYGLGSGHLRFYLAPKASHCSLCSKIEFLGTYANLRSQNSSVTMSKRIIQRFEEIWAMLTMKLYDNGENLTEKRCFHCIHIRIRGYKMFTIIYIFSGRVFDIANFSR
jgi:hypothetical protein